MPPSTSTWDARRTELELPEEIDLQVELANVGSRSLAILVDLAVGGLVLFIVYALTMLLAHDVANDWLTRLSSNALKTLLMLLIFGFQWCYFNLFEWIWNGQTPGKRLLHLRVIKPDGSVLEPEVVAGKQAIDARAGRARAARTAPGAGTSRRRTRC